ncbi:OmpA-OmpF porin, OOP family [Malonomonas rubra DSM 5091]|uniref:OmpA-OmpF porin, OOP family n=1 Tax=Malonomonas rubra DSM 5091 TaxID=1122189 RepID=A0A1M6DTD4_MALRU|nr:outer membrane beta-barrel protein [Malonomonas rubra]SHI76462.1 OmpA-OmpF porin, OOP family [Malonomonas rubra DSM 5091]
MTIKRVWILSLALLSLFFSSVQAEEKHGWPTLTLTGGGYSIGSSADIDADSVYGIKLGYEVNGRGFADRLGVEAVYQHLEGESDLDNSDVDLDLLRLDLLYLFTAPKSATWLEPFLTIGGGALFVAGEERKSSEDPLLTYGVGSKFKLTDFLKLRLDMRHLMVFGDDSRSDFEYTAGLSYYFGVERKPKKKIDVTDSDKDGVFDSKDKCPDTPAGLQVDKRGCPVDAPDADADGVADYQDACPATPAGLNVDEKGCFFDDDGDGVPNELDRCPSNPPGFQVDENGCTKLIRRSEG